MKGMVPSHLEGEQADQNQLPNQQLSLQYVFGCRTQFEGNTIYNMVKYSFTGKIVFPTAGIVVVQETKVNLLQQHRPQTFFVRHSQDIISMAMHPKGNIVATGTAAPEYKTMLVEIMIWEVESKAMICFIQDFHLRGVSHLEFSPDGTLLLTLGLDDDHSLAIYDWQANRLLCTSKVDKSPITAISWRGPSRFVTCGERHFKFWTQQGRNLKYNQGNFTPTNGDSTYEPQTAMVFAFQMEVVSGSEQGNIYLWKQTATCQKYPHSHEGRVNMLISIKQALYSAGADGQVKLWNLNQNQLQVTQTIVEMSRVIAKPMMNCSILSMDMKNESFAIMLEEGELWECINGNPIRTNQLLTWHYGGPLLSLTALVGQKKFVTCGSDGVLRLWDWDSKKQIATYKVTEHDQQLRALDCNSDGSLLVVGDFKCHLYLFETQNFKLLDKRPTKFASMKPRKGSYMISELKFSPDSRKIAIGAQGGPSHVEIWEIEDRKQFAKPNQSGNPPMPLIANLGFTSSLTHLDWSQDGLFILATSDSYELKFLSLQRARDVSVNLVRDIQWASWTCPYGYQVSGIYTTKNENDITALQTSSDKSFIAVGDVFGKLRIFCFPVTYLPIQLHRSYNGHMGRIQKIVYLGQAETQMVTIGEKDRTILLWQIETETKQLKKEVSNELEESISKQEAIDNKLRQLELPQFQVKKVGIDKFGKAPKNIDMQQEGQMMGDDDEVLDLEDEKSQNFIFMKPWMGNVKEPKNYYKDPINQEKPPLIDLQLEHAHGYRSNDCRNNVRYLKNGQIVYHTASLGVVMDIINNSQRFFNFHRDDIISLDVHLDGIRVATGEIGPNPSIFVWDSNTLQPLCMFNGQLTQGICSLNFSPQLGDKLVAAAIDDQHEVAVFEINTKSSTGGSFLLKERSGTDNIIEVRWKSEFEFVSVGPFHLRIWSITSASLISRPINIQTTNNQMNISNIYISCVIVGDDMFLGDADGQIQQWKYQNNNFNHVQTGSNHDNQLVEAISIYKDFIVTGGKDSKINIINLRDGIKSVPVIQLKFNEVAKQAIRTEIKSVQFLITSDTRSILVGTYGGDIWELSTKDQQKITKFQSVKSIIKSHYNTSKKSNSEIWGLAFNPQEPDVYYTCGDDATLRIWSLSQKRQTHLIKTNLDSTQNEIKPDEHGDFPDSVKGRSITVSPDGQFIVIGFKDGSLRVFDKDNKQKCVIKVAKEWISDLKFNPEGNFLAIGSHDNSIYLYTFPELKIYNKPLRKHSEFIKGIDFSVDGKKIHSICGGFDLLFWDIEGPKQLPKGALNLRDEKWHTWTITLGWPVQGIWEETSDGTDINCVERSHLKYIGDEKEDKPPDNYYLLAVGNDYNEVRVYRYPCVQRGAAAVIGRGHSAPISCVAFSNDDNYLVSVGGSDQTVLQWKVIKKLGQ